MTFDELHALLATHSQAHVLRFFDELSAVERANLTQQIEGIDFALLKRLIDEWVLTEPKPQAFSRIDPISVIPRVDPTQPGAREALAIGEAALREGRVGLIMVAGGQGTRLGFDGPKGSYPIAPLSRRSFLHYHADKIHNIQRRYGCTIPWYIMVSEANAEATAAFFRTHNHFGLAPEDIIFFQQRMMPCVSDTGALMLETKSRLAMNPNGHGGSLLAMVDEGIVRDAHARGITTLSYVQVDNWAVKVADPYFLGYHLMGKSEMSSKVHRKSEPRESVGVHCLCDGTYQVIEYSELDIYPQLLDTDSNGAPIHFAGNPAIHIIEVDFVERMYAEFDKFPWHRAHKKVPFIDETGNCVQPDAPNAYKFETFVFDALQFARSTPVALEIHRAGEYTPTKQFDGPNSVVAARESMREYWGGWLDAAGYTVPRDANGRVTVDIEISPAFALSEEEFVEHTRGFRWPAPGPLAIGPDGAMR